MFVLKLAGVQKKLVNKNNSLPIGVICHQTPTHTYTTYTSIKNVPLIFLPPQPLLKNLYAHPCMYSTMEKSILKVNTVSIKLVLNKFVYHKALMRIFHNSFLTTK